MPPIMCNKTTMEYWICGTDRFERTGTHSDLFR
jgi:hypothetical protein